MSVVSKGYQLLQHNIDEQGENENIRDQQTIPRSRHLTTTAIITLLFLAASISINLFLGLRQLQLCIPQTSDCRSSYAGLKRNVPIQIYDYDDFVNENFTAASALWEDLSGDPGVVALADDWVAEKRLPRALRFPWDESKGVYLLQGFHNLHCLRTVYRSVMDFHYGRPQRIALIHILHCLDQLRQDVVCNADDTPRYAGFQDPPGTGSGQVRMCKDWSRLEKWARNHTACFKHEDETPSRLVDRFKFCPDGKRMWSSDNNETP